MKKDLGCCNLAQKRHSLNPLPYPRKKPRSSTASSASICIKPLGLPLISKSTQLPCKSLHLDPDKPYTIGRSHSCCDFLFDDKKVSKTHCQIVFDSYCKRVLLSDGGFFRASLNGVFVNEVRIGEGEIVGLCAGDEVLLACGNGSVCDGEKHVGFFVERIVFLEEVVGRNVCSQQFDRKAAFLLSMCRDILCSNDPISFMKKYAVFGDDDTGDKRVRTWEKGLFRVLRNNFSAKAKDNLTNNEALRHDNLVVCEGLTVDTHKEATVAPETVARSLFCNVDGSAAGPVDNSSLQNENVVCLSSKTKVCCTESPRNKDCNVCEEGDDDDRGSYVPPPGRKFYLNRLQDMDHSSTNPCDVVSLPELFYPIKSLTRVFIATFTSDIPWFLSYCGIPAHLPVTIACHNAEKCWSSNPDKRTSSPYSDFPQLVIVHPPFPEVIAFGKDRKKSGIACHHPKLFVLQREDSIRVVITSANLVERQWLSVTNTVWWQDFPRSTAPEYFLLFMQSSFGENYQKSKSDFAAQLAGFIASLVVDIPSQAHWVPELAKYCFEGALVHLVASVPGVYSPRRPYISDSKHYLCGNQKMLTSSCENILGSVETCVVGLSHLFHTKADSKGIKLKKLASLNCCENVYGMSEIVLRRETNISADVNAVSVLVPNPKEISVEGCIQIGFLPREIAKWIAPLSDGGFFAFSAYICPKDVLRAALEGRASRVELIIYVSQGPCFSRISDSMTSTHLSAFCSLVASVQRCVGLWRLHEILGTYKWPEHLETDFCFGSSSIGAVNSKFLAAFSAAAGKRAVELSESEESDPYWGGWSASQELKKPSIKIIFPTIERLKSATRGISASRCLLCFSQKTWQRLKNVGILYDAIPSPSNRVGHPMHVKVARRRFQSKRNGTSFGWVYCGSHNFSAAAWGRPLSQAADLNTSMNTSSSSILGSRLHICNYEIGIIFTVLPSESKACGDDKSGSLDDITLPYVTPAPKYRAGDRAATAQAMREAMRELSSVQREIDESVSITGECPDEEEEEEMAETGNNIVTEEKEEERAYATKLWSQVGSS